MKRHGIYNRIALLVTVLFIVFTGVLGVRGLFYNALALEQEVRCGIPAHTHGTMCYDGHHRICGQEEHSHNRNCYIVLLEDNDINDLLVQMSVSVDNSLESVINQTVNNALVYNTNLTSPLAAGTTLADVAALNSTVEENNVTPSVVFNENIQTRAGSNDTLGAALPNGTSSGGVSTLALDDKPATGQYNVNFYVNIDGTWRVVGSQSFTVQRQGLYRAQTKLASALNLYNNAVGLSLQASDVNKTVRFYWNTNTNTDFRNSAKVDGEYLILGDTYYNNNNNSGVRSLRHVRLYDNSGSPIVFNTVTLQHSDGSTTVKYIKNGTSFTLPEGDDWTDGSEDYTGGTAVPIDGPVTFTVSDGSIFISYDVNFPDEIEDVTLTASLLKPGLPTLAGLPETKHRDKVEVGAESLIRNVSYPEVRAPLTNSGTGQHRAIYFMGWRTADGQIISHNTRFTWEELSTRVGSRKTLQLTGVWDYEAKHTATFYVRYDSKPADTSGSVGGQDSQFYTNELFSTFVTGVDTSIPSTTLTNMYGIADSADNSYTADQSIRALHGNKEEGEVGLVNFPSDEEIFKLLKADTKDVIKVDGVEVNRDHLNDNYYSIRWYVFKCQDDAWHIDGRLVKKEGILDVTKTFAGNATAISEAKNGFYITAQNTATNGETYYLCINASAAPDGALSKQILTPTESSGNVYRWRITGTRFGDDWELSEQTGNPSNVIVHSDYRVVDTYGEQNFSGTILPKDPEKYKVDITASTVATDMDKWYPLTVNFTNIYHNTDSIIIKKEDYLTGKPIGGAIFQLEQNDIPMKFVHDTAANIFRYDPDAEEGTYVTELSSAGSGYYELNIQDFSYADGDVVIRELYPPDGYTAIADITIGYLTETTPSNTDNQAETQSVMFAAKSPIPDDTGPPQETVTEPVTDPVTNPVTEPVTDPVTNPVTEPGTEPGTDPDKETGTEPGTDPDKEPDEELGTDPDKEPGTEPGTGENTQPAKLMMATGQPSTEVAAAAETKVVALLTPSEMASYNNGLLIIRNSTEKTSLTVTKKWRCRAEDWRDVTMQLMANNAPVTSLISGIPLTKELNESSEWTATWENLPQYANGQPITWSVREVKIGEENCLSDYKFVNWVVEYSPPVYRLDSNNKIVHTDITVTNDTFRTMLRLIKTDTSGTSLLKGATFQLEHLINGNVDADFTVRTATTEADGTYTFENIKYGDYRLTEVKAPAGYEEMTQPIFLTIQGNGVVVVQEHPYALSGNSAYTVQVLNAQLRPLPSTGGIGDTPFYLLGLLLIAGALGSAWFSHRRRGGVSPP